MIPRIFHRIWMGGSPMPTEHEEFGRSWARLHPGWEMRLWTDDDLPELVNQVEFERSRTFSGKANVARYEILHRFGGVYIDTDFECLRCIDPIIENQTAFAGLMSPGIVNNAIIGSVANHSFMSDAIRSLPGYFLANWIGNTLTQSGPSLITSLTRFTHPEVHLFPSEIFYPYTYEKKHLYGEKFDPAQYPQAYAVHHWFQSWQNDAPVL